jgi:hypothetical protein
VARFSLSWNQGTGALLVPKKGIKPWSQRPKIILPYEPGYVGNKEADKRRKETKERARQREREFAERQQPPLIVPERLRAASVGGFVTVEVSKSAHTAQASA